MLNKASLLSVNSTECSGLNYWFSELSTIYAAYFSIYVIEYFLHYKVQKVTTTYKSEDNVKNIQQNKPHLSFPNDVQGRLNKLNISQRRHSLWTHIGGILPILLLTHFVPLTLPKEMVLQNFKVLTCSDLVDIAEQRKPHLHQDRSLKSHKVQIC